MSILTRRFWVKVNKTKSCWLWQGNCFTEKRGGYGAFSLTHTKKVYAHRTAWKLVKGGIPRGLCVLHKCDTPKCVRPSHLFLGTRRDNSKDMTKKGRQARGERLPQTKLTLHKVRAMRSLRSSTFMTYEAIAVRFGVSQSQAYRAINKQRWKYVA